MPKKTKKPLKVAETKAKPVKRTPRYSEEDVPSANYVDTLITLGPRKGERYTTFWRRIGGLERVRRMWREVWYQVNGDGAAAARGMHIHQYNLGDELRIVGLSREILNVFLEQDKGRASNSGMPPVKDRGPLPEQLLDPALDYVNQLVSKGPRPGEKYMEFWRRIGAIEKGRQLWTVAWRQAGGDAELAAKLLHVEPSYITFELKLVGLTREILNIYLEQGTLHESVSKLKPNLQADGEMPNLKLGPTGWHF